MADKTEARNLGRTVPTTPRLLEESDDIAIPDSWDEGEETADDVYGTAQEESNTEGDESENGLPGLDEPEGSLLELDRDEAETSEDSGYEFINTPPNTWDEGVEATPEDFEAAPETTEEQEEEKKEENMYKEIDENDKEAQLQESAINFLLNMEDPDYKDPEPCTGLTCPLTGEQYYVD